MQFSLSSRGWRWVFSALALFCTTILSAQMLDIRGIVTDESGEPLAGVTIIHRFGRLTPGENIMMVLTVSQHRAAAFEAAQFLMDYLKTSAPFWKREERAGGAAWVEARGEDDAAAARWTER